MTMCRVFIFNQKRHGHSTDFMSDGTSSDANDLALYVPARLAGGRLVEGKSGAHGGAKPKVDWPALVLDHPSQDPPLEAICTAPAPDMAKGFL